MNTAADVCLFVGRYLAANMYPSRNKVITPSKTRCKYPITMGLKPKARSLSEGMVEPNYNNNFINRAMAENSNTQLSVGESSFLSSNHFFFSI